MNTDRACAPVDTRSDSDLFTFGYGFKPWIGNPIATRQQILDYLGSVIADANLAPHIRYKHRVRSANWSSTSNTWSLEVETAEGQRRMNIQTNFLWMCQGYYRHSHGYTPAWPGMDQFKGQVIHPQNWPEDLDLTGKRVTVIGSGATAATLIPAMAGQCAHVTMLQRTPTYFATGRNSDALAEELRSLGIDETWIHEIMRRKVVRERADIIEKAKNHPDVMKKHLIAGVKASLPEGFDVDKHFTPPYRPFQQRVGAEAVGITADVSDAAAMQTVADQIEIHYGAIHLVFNNAGVTSSGPVWESTEKDWDWLLGINLKGVVNGVRSFTPKMLAAAASDKSYEGCVVNTASLAGILAGPGMGIYSVSKHAVVALSECLHYDLQLVSPQVRAAVLCPSYVPTAIGNSDRNRPTHLVNEKPPTKAQMASLAAAQQAVAQGNITATKVAEITFKSIEQGCFYIFPSPEGLALFKLRSDNILNQVTPEFPYELFPAMKDRRDRMLAAQSKT